MRGWRAWAFAVAAGSLASCMSWRPGWQDLAVAGAAGAGAERTASALERFAAADSREKVLASITAFEEALAAEPDNLQATVALAEAHVLLGAAYESARRAKADAYLRGIQLCERAMATNPAFLRSVRGGASVSEAAGHLGQREMGAMFWWVTGVSYYFKECLWGPGYVVNFRWMKRASGLLSRMDEIDPAWQDGSVYFTWGVYYLALPASVGGDMAKSAAYFARAEEAAPTSLLIRWGRAKYHAEKAGDTRAIREDLEWVLAQDPHSAVSPYRWNVYFQRDARAMLAASAKAR